MLFLPLFQSVMSVCHHPLVCITWNHNENFTQHQKKKKGNQHRAGGKKSSAKSCIEKHCGLSFLRNHWCICETCPWCLSCFLVSKLLTSRINYQQKSGTETKIKPIFVRSVPSGLQQVSLADSERQSVSHEGKQTLLCWPRQKGHPTPYPRPGVTQRSYVRRSCSRLTTWLRGDDDDRDGRGALVTDHRTVLPSVMLLQSALLQSSCGAALFAVSAQKTTQKTVNLCNVE